MNKKGFTLIELLAVVFILGLLVAIISPVVNNLLRDSEDALSKEQIEMVLKATKKYMVEHSELLPDENSTLAVSLSDLISDGVIDNDKIIDPKTMKELDGCVVVSYSNEFNQYEYNYRSNCHITVTFDADGGSVSESSRDYLIGSKYGELPIPTRDGYTFMGWNGKNLFNEEVLLMAIDGATYENNHYNFTFNNLHQKYYNNNQSLPIYDFKESSQYTITLFGYVDEHDDAINRLGVYCKYNQDSSITNVLFLNDTIESKRSATFGTGLKEIKMSYANGSGIYAHISHIQLEEGDTATEWEPYYVTSDVKVTQESDHILKAIWKANS